MFRGGSPHHTLGGWGSPTSFPGSPSFPKVWEGKLSPLPPAEPRPGFLEHPRPLASVMGGRVGKRLLPTPPTGGGECRRRDPFRVGREGHRVWPTCSSLGPAWGSSSWHLPRLSWPGHSRWPSSQSPAPEASHPGPGSGRVTGVCPGGGGCQSTQCK